MANIGQIVAEITATTAGLRRAQQDASRQFGQIQNEADATAKAVKIAFAVAASAAVLMFVKALASATDGANETKKAMMGLQSTSRAFGQNFDDATKSVKELYSDGIMPLDKSIRGFKNLLSVGFNVDEAMQVSKAMKNIGAFNNVIGDLGQAYEDSTKGLKTNSMELIENIGLTQRISAVLKAANVDFSDGIDLTNNAAQRRAVYNAILAEGAKFEGDAAKLANDNASANAKLSAAWKEMSDNLGNRVAPAFSSILGLMTKITNAISDTMKETNLEKATKQAEEQATAFYGLSFAYLELKQKTKLTADETKRYKDIIDEMQKKYGSYLTNINLEKDNYNKVKDAINGATLALQKNISVKLARAELEDITEQQVKDQQKLKGYIQNTTKSFNENITTAKKIGKVKIATELVNNAPKFFEVTSDQAYKIYSDLEDKIKDTSGKISNTEKNEAIKRKNILEQSLLDNANMEKNGSLFLNSIRNAKNNSDYLNTLYKSTIKSREDFQNKYKEVLSKYEVTPTDFETTNTPTSTTTTGEKDKFKPDTSKTLEQKKKELEYRLKADLANAKEEEKYLIQLKYNQAVKVAEAEDKYAKAIASAKTQKAAKDAMDTLIKSVGESEVELNAGIKVAEEEATAKKKAEEWKPDTSKTLEQKKKELEYNLKADLVNAKEEEKNIIKLKYASQAKILEIEDTFAKEVAGAKTQAAVEEAYDKMITAIGEEEIQLKTSIKIEEGIWEKIQKEMPGLGLVMTVAGLQGKKKKPPKTQEELDKELDKAINDTISSFAALANELDNNFMKSLANIAEASISMKNSYGTFATGQSQGGLLGGLGMLSGGIGMFTSAVSIFQSVGGLFSKSTYNFDEAVKKMLEGIGEKAPDVQVTQFNAAQSLSELDKTKTGKTAGKVIWSSGNTDENKQLMNETEKYLQQAFTVQQVLSNYGKSTLDYYKDESGKIIATISTSIASGEKMITFYNGAAELIANIDKIVPQLAEQLGTAAEDFGSDIASALSNASTFTAFSENLEDNVFSSVKSGLISAFIASDAMKNLLEPLQKSITIAVANDYKISDSEMNDIKAQMEGIENIAKPFYDALEAVGLNLVDASDSLASESDRLSSTINRNLRLAERIQMTNTGSSQVINIDFTGANLGGVSEASMVGIMNRATAQSNIAKNGVR